MIVVNFSHPLTPTQREQLSAMTGQNVDQVLDEKADFDDTRPYADQVCDLLDQVPLSAEEWQSLSVVVNLPSYAVIAAGVLAELHGRIGHFPTVAWLIQTP